MARALYLSGFIIVSLLLLYAVTGLPDDPPSDIISESPTATNADSGSSKKDAAQPSPEPKVPFIADQQQCDALQSAVNGLNRTYFEDLELSEFLEDGYSADDVTLAIHTLRNANFAREWRDTHRKKDSQLNKLNQEMNEALRTQLPDMPSSMKIFRAVPAKHLEQAVNSNQPLDAKSEEQLIVDDVAWLMQQPTIPDSAIKPFVLRLSDINMQLGSSFVIDKHPVSLLDVAAFNRRPALAQWLISQGATPVSDPYLGTTLDYVLAGLSRFPEDALQQHNDTVSNQIALANDLVEQGVKTVSDFDDGGLKSRFSANLFIIREDKANLLQLNYGFDLQTLPHMPPLTSENAKSLISLMQSHQDAMKAERIGSDAQEKLSRCQAFKSRVEQAWSPKWLRGSLTEKRDDELYDMAPELVMCKRKMIMYADAIQGRRSALNEDLFYRRLSDGEWQNAVAMLTPFPEALTRIFHEAVVYKPESYATFVGAGLEPETWNFSYFEDGRFVALNIEKLKPAGIELHATDKFGRSLLFPVVNSGNPDALKYLRDSGVPYYQIANTPDPLYLALYHIATRNRQENAGAFIDILMSYTPSVRLPHLAQMKVMKLKFPSLYEEITDAYPQLAVESKDVTFPEYSCM